MLILPAGHDYRVLLPQLPAEWRAPSLAEPHQNQTRFRLTARLNDGFIKWRGWFDDREDMDAFLHALIRCVTLGEPIPITMWRLPTPWWHPDIGPYVIYAVDTVVYITTSAGSNQSWSKPVDWTDTNNVQAVGGGGNGGPSGGNSTGGGGGAYSKSVNLTGLSASITVRVGSAGGDSWFNSTTMPGSGQAVGAKGGSTGLASGGGNAAGGAAASGYATGTGNVKQSGGLSTAGTGSGGGSGGGGAGGPLGDGGAGGQNGGFTAGGGGGGNGGGTAGAAATSNNNGGTGGNNNGGTGHGNGGTGGTAATAGTNGGGGGGGEGSNGNAGDGGPGTDLQSSKGSGGGGGSSNSTGTVGNGGLYGGAGGGRGSGTGAQGIVVATYTPASGRMFWAIDLSGIGASGPFFGGSLAGPRIRE